MLRVAFTSSALRALTVRFPAEAPVAVAFRVASTALAETSQTSSAPKSVPNSRSIVARKTASAVWSTAQPMKFRAIATPRDAAGSTLRDAVPGPAAALTWEVASMTACSASAWIVTSAPETDPPITAAVTAPRTTLAANSAAKATASLETTARSRSAIAAACVVEVRTAPSVAETSTSPVTAMVESVTVALVVRFSRFQASAAAMVTSGVPGIMCTSPPWALSRLASRAATVTATGLVSVASRLTVAALSSAVVTPVTSMRASLPVAAYAVSVVALTIRPPTVRTAPVTLATASSLAAVMWAFPTRSDVTLAVTLPVLPAVTLIRSAAIGVEVAIVAAVLRVRSICAWRLPKSK